MPQTQNRVKQQEGAMVEEINPMEDLMAYLRDYVREKPEMAALCCLGIGFVLGWKLKPW